MPNFSTIWNNTLHSGTNGFAYRTNGQIWEQTVNRTKNCDKARTFVGRSLSQFAFDYHFFRHRVSIQSNSSSKS